MGHKSTNDKNESCHEINFHFSLSLRDSVASLVIKIIWRYYFLLNAQKKNHS